MTEWTAEEWARHTHSKVVPCVRGLCPGFETAGAPVEEEVGVDALFGLLMIIAGLNSPKQLARAMRMWLSDENLPKIANALTVIDNALLQEQLRRGIRRS